MPVFLDFKKLTDAGCKKTERHSNGRGVDMICGQMVKLNKKQGEHNG